MSATSVADRYATAHLAALRAAAAVLAARARPVRGRRGSAWELISKVAPEFAEWASFFAAGSAKRQAAEAGINRLVSPREADDMIRQVGAFIDLVEDALTSGSEPRQGVRAERRALR
ncbi:MAG: SAV_6107 family HEPN domain-containing protein [Nakamurella sp.]